MTGTQLRQQQLVAAKHAADGGKPDATAISPDDAHDAHAANNADAANGDANAKQQFAGMGMQLPMQQQQQMQQQNMGMPYCIPTNFMQQGRFM